MRLTLRTMLAYLDDVLDSGETRELEQKIEESSFASGLVHRIRDSTRRLRLGAPKVTGKGIGLDANSVAEYLDSTLPSEQVPEFEKVCLESDVHLAEVASSHQILAIVLGEPAEVSPELRERIYRIGEAESPSANGTGGFSNLDEIAPAMGSVAVGANGTNGSHVVKAPVARSRAQSGVRIKSLAITLALVFLIVLAALQVIGVDRIKNLFGGGSASVVEAPKGLQSPVTPPESGQPDLEVDSSPGPSEVVASPVTEQAPPLVDSGEEPPDVIEAAATDLVPPPIAELPSEIPAETTSGADAIASVPAAETPPPVSGSEPVESAEVPAEVARERMPVGRYISDNGVAAGFNHEENAWYGLLSDGQLRSGDRLVALPTYRPQLLLLPALKVTIAGESVIELGAPKETSETEISMETGRLLLIPFGDPNVITNLTLAGRRATLRFADEQSAVGIEVKHYLAPGSDAKAHPTPRVVQVYSINGKIGWEEAGQDLVEINEGEVLAFIGDAPAALFAGGQLPKWVDGSNLTHIDRRSSDELLRYLTPDRPLSLSLMERTEFRRVEIRALASQSLCTLDIFDPALEALNDESQHSYWGWQVDALRAAMARSPESVAKVERTVEKLSGEQASTVLRLLQGYSPEQLAAGGAAELVAALEHDRMIIRVLAYENLRRITGKTPTFHPERDPKLEKSKVMKWQRNLEEGLIVYETPPSPLPPRESISR